MTEGLVPTVAAYGLAGTRLAFPDQPLDDRTWAAVLAGARAERLVGLLGAAVADGALPTTEEQFEQAGQAHLEAMHLVLRLEQLLLVVSERLTAASIPLRVLKGPAVAHRFYPDPSWRPFADIDVLVPSDGFDRAVGVVTADGGVRQFPQPRAGFDRRFSKGTSFAMPSGMEIDLHRTFVAGPFGLAVDLDDVWRGSWSFALGGITMQGLDLETSFLNLCYHAALGDSVPRPLTLRDVGQVLVTQPLDPLRVRELAHRWRAEAVVARAIVVACRTLGVEPDHPLVPWATTFRFDRAAERTLAVYATPGNAYPGQALLALRAIPGTGPKLSYLRAIVWPDRAYVAGRYRGQYSRWARSLQAIRRLRREE